MAAMAMLDFDRHATQFKGIFWPFQPPCGVNRFGTVQLFLQNSLQAAQLLLCPRLHVRLGVGMGNDLCAVLLKVAVA